MKCLILPSKLKGRIFIPSSKSHTLRAILFAALGKGRSIIENPLSSPDTVAMIDACHKFGAKIEKRENLFVVHGVDGTLNSGSYTIDAGNSGQVLRFAGSVASLGDDPIHFTGDHSIQTNRPIKPLLEGLSQLGVKTYSHRNNGYAPFTVQGRLKPGLAIIDGEDSQPVSGLLIASAFCKGPVELKVLNAGEKPWIGLTLSWFDRLNIAYKEQEKQWYRMEGCSSYEGFNYSVPGDFSSASFAIVAALITHSEVILENIDMSDSQGDKAIITLLQKLGASIEIDPLKKECVVKKNGSFRGGTIDINDMIDALPIFTVLSCFAEEKTVLLNAAVARKKECDRLSVITENLRLMGAKIDEEQDQLTIYPASLIGSPLLESYYDHRVAMALSVAAIGARGSSIVHNCTCVEKSYSTFFEDFQNLGANFSLQ